MTAEPRWIPLEGAATARDLGGLRTDGGVIELTLRNTTADPITVGVAPFLTTLNDDAIAPRPADLGVWGYQVMPPDEPCVYAVPGEVGIVACSTTGGGTRDGTLATGTYEFEDGPQSFDGAVELAHILAERPEVHRCYA